LQSLHHAWQRRADLDSVSPGVAPESVNSAKVVDGSLTGTAKDRRWDVVVYARVGAGRKSGYGQG
jgi:hypothetical protein